MQYDLVRDRLVAILENTSGIGRVFPMLRLSTDLQTFVERFTVTHPGDPTKLIASVAFVTRQSSIELMSWAEHVSAVGDTVQETYRITVLYGFDDDDDIEAASDTHFQRLLDRITGELRFADPTTFAPEVIRVYPPQILNAGLFTQELNNYLCHKAEIDVRVEFWVVS